MKIGHIYYKCKEPGLFRNTLDESPADFGESMRVKEQLEKLRSWPDFDQLFVGPFVREFHRVLIQVLVKQRRTLSIGSCFGEHEAPFIRDGYDIVCSDFNSDVISHMRENFGADRYLLLDIFAPQLSRNDFQDLLVTGLDYAFDDVKTVEIFQSCRKLLSDSSAQGEKRLLFTLRYNDNWATRFIDQALLPFENEVKNILMRVSRSQTRYLRKAHGFRRSRREIIAIAAREGFQLQRTVQGGYGVELTRSAIANRLPWLVELITRVDPFLTLFNNITLFEFVAV